MEGAKIRESFFTLLRAGLWEQRAKLLPFMPLGFNSLYELADEQSVVGLISAGIEHVEDMKISKPMALPFLKKVFSLERRNQAMNEFIGKTVKMLRDREVYALLVKGQGVAQCYAKPQWRSAGDVDFFLDAENYEKAKAQKSWRRSGIRTGLPSMFSGRESSSSIHSCTFTMR